MLRKGAGSVRARHMDTAQGLGSPEPDSAPSDLRLLHSFKNLDLGYSSSEPQFPHLSHEDDVPPIL